MSLADQPLGSWARLFPNLLNSISNPKLKVQDQTASKRWSPRTRCNQKLRLKVSFKKVSLTNFLVSDQVKNEGSMSVKKEVEQKKKEKKEIGKKRTHRQARANKFLDVEAKEEDESEDDPRTTKSEVKLESGMSSRVYWFFS